MNASSSKPIPYRVVYSGRVKEELTALVDRAVRAGKVRAVREALVELDRRLRIYPQDGECRRNLAMPGQSLWDAAFPPLTIQYVIDDVNRAVYVVKPITVLPYAGFQ